MATGPPSSPSTPKVTYASPRAPRCLAHSCQASNARRGWSAPPGITTAPTCSAWKTRNPVPAKYPVRSASSSPKRRSGLSDPYRDIASANVIRGTSPTSTPSTPCQIARTTASPTSMTSSWSTNDISMSSWVNSGWRSARKSSSR